VITVELHGVSCHFDDTSLDRKNPGSIYRHLLQNRFYEQQFLEYIRGLRLTGAYVDVGAYIGTHTLFFAMMCQADHVYAFEPRDAMYDELRRNIALNDVTQKVSAFNWALADRAGKLTVQLDRQLHTFDTRSLDSLVDVPIALMKLDVEGAEPAVLDGSARILDRWRPIIFAEAGTGPEFQALVECLDAHAYQPTGRSWNATPTYEFIPRPKSRRLGPIPFS
jgi:FkbM family methyltransferase